MPDSWKFCQFFLVKCISFFLKRRVASSPYKTAGRGRRTFQLMMTLFNESK